MAFAFVFTTLLSLLAYLFAAGMVGSLAWCAAVLFSDSVWFAEAERLLLTTDALYLVMGVAFLYSLAGNIAEMVKALRREQ